MGYGTMVESYGIFQLTVDQNVYFNPFLNTR